MATGHPDLVVPSSSSEYAAMVDALRAHHSAMHGQATDVAAALRSILPDIIAGRGGGRRGLGGLDNKMVARLIVKPIMDAAALNRHAASLYVLTYRRYVEHVVNVNTAARPQFKVDG
jgi:hypothetical protein